MRTRRKRDLSIYNNIKDEFEQLYCVQFMKVADIAEYFNMPVKRVYSLIEFFGFERDAQKAKSISLSKSESKSKLFIETKSRISKDDIIKWYIEEDHDYDEAPEHFGITQSMFDKLCREYKIKKDKSLSRQKTIARIEDKYGKEYWNDVISKRAQTLIDEWGSLEEAYKHIQETIVQHNIKQCGFRHPATAKMFERYGDIFGTLWVSKEASIEYLKTFTEKPTTAQLADIFNIKVYLIRAWIKKYKLRSFIVIKKKRHTKNKNN